LDLGGRCGAIDLREAELLPIIASRSRQKKYAVYPLLLSPAKPIAREVLADSLPLHLFRNNDGSQQAIRAVTFDSSNTNKHTVRGNCYRVLRTKLRSGIQGDQTSRNQQFRDGRLVGCYGWANRDPGFPQVLGLNEFANATSDLIAQGTDLFDGLSFGIGQRPVLTSQAGNIRAIVTAAHGNQHLRTFCQFRSEFLWPGISKVYAHFAHRFNNNGVNAVAWLCTRGDRPGFAGVGKLPEKSCRYLRTPSVVNACKDESTH
jgi:hypothetical protein